jgi:hypothetical protein
MTDQALSPVLDFDPGAVEADPAGYQPIPAGDYHVAITMAEVRATKSDPEYGRRIALTFKVVDGDYRGRTINDGLNVKNKNKKAEEIGRKQLAQLLEAVGMPGERDVSRLVGEELIVAVKIKPAQGEYDAGNAVKWFKPLKSGGVAKPPAGKKAPPPFMGG